MSDDAKIGLPGIMRPIQPLRPTVLAQKKAPAGSDKKKKQEKKKNRPDEGDGGAGDEHIDIMA